MPNIKSAKKSVLVTAKKTDNNHEAKARVKNSIRNCEKQIAANDVDAANATFKEVQKNIDNALSKGLIKANTAARQKARLAQKIKAMK